MECEGKGNRFGKESERSKWGYDFIFSVSIPFNDSERPIFTLRDHISHAVQKWNKVISTIILCEIVILANFPTYNKGI